MDTNNPILPTKLFYQTFIRLLVATCLWLITVNTLQAAIAFRGSSQAFVRSGASISDNGSGQSDTWYNDWVWPQLPSGYSVGDLFICLVESRDNVAINVTSPSGWTKLYSIANGTQSQASLFYKFASSTSESDPFFTHNSGGSIIANCSAFSGVDPANPFDTAYATAASGADKTVETGSLTTVTPGAMLLFAGHMADDHSNLNVTTTGGLSWNNSFFKQSSYGNGQAISLDFAKQTAPGTVGPIVGTVSYSGSSTAAVSNGTLLALRPLSAGLTIKVPAGTVSDDVMIASISVTSGSVTINPPTGWTLVRSIQNTSSTTSRLAVFQRVATASEPASYQWTFGSSHSGVVGGILSFSGVDKTNPIATENGNTTASSTTHTASSITPTSTNMMIVGTFSYASSGTWTPPSGMTEAVDAASRTPNTSSGESMEMVYQLQATATAIGNKSAVVSATADSGIAHLLALNPSGGGVGTLDHIQIEHDGSGVTCSPEVIVIKACADATCSVLYAASTTVTLAPSATSYISWGSNPITFTGSTSVNLAVTNSQTITLGTSAITPASLNASRCYVNATQNCSLPFIASGFIFSSVPSQTAGVSSSAISLQAVAGSSGGTCSGLASGSKNIEMAFQCVDPSTCAGQQVNINGTNIAINPATGVSAYTSVPLTFDSASKASLALIYPDVGKINLVARYALGGGSYMQGNSNVFVVKPWGFGFSNIKRTADNFANPAANTATGTIFIKAGNTFSSTITSINSSGTATPNFGKEATPEGILLSNSLVAPSVSSGGSIGTLGGSLLANGSLFTNGGIQITDLSWDDVGIIALVANIADGNYLGAGNVNAISGNIGRFIPDHFSTTITPACSSATPFTYSGQHADITLSALDASGDMTVNYDYSLGFAKTVTLSNAGDATGFTLNTLYSEFAGGVGTDTDVVYTFPSKSTPPKTLNIRATDSDGVTSNALNEDTDLIYSGRLNLQNALGSELLDLSMSLQAQVWNGSDYIVNNDDSCTGAAIPTSGSGLTFGGNLTSAMTTLSINGITNGTNPLISGLGNMVWSKPGANNTGYVDIVIAAPSWLDFNWKGAGDTDPSARATFGLYKGSDNQIYFREVY
ncbi:MAG: DUF6701 domain-containing protein [Methylococcales bacterium]|nr:hypothetical protein [Methylococcaceae bacterium]